MKKIILIIGITGVIFIDAVSKFIAENHMQSEIPFLPFVSFYYHQNPGIAFGIPLTGAILKILTLVLISGIIWYYWKREKRKGCLLPDIGYILIIGGAIGNAWERILRGYVTDFIAVPYFSVFNIADSALCLGVALMIFLSFRDNH